MRRMVGERDEEIEGVSGMMKRARMRDRDEECEGESATKRARVRKF